MHKQYEEEAWRIENAADATITFTIALRGPHAWEMQLEDSRRYHSISHGWATDDPHDWEDIIARVLRHLFVKGRLGAPRPLGNLCRQRSVAPSTASSAAWNAAKSSVHDTGAIRTEALIDATADAVT
jgi:hypothetical protein